MAQTNAAQRAEATRLVALHTARAGCWSDDVADSLLTLLPALLADAGALAAREAEEAAFRQRVEEVGEYLAEREWARDERTIYTTKEN